MTNLFESTNSQAEGGLMDAPRHAYTQLFHWFCSPACTPQAHLQQDRLHPSEFSDSCCIVQASSIGMRLEPFNPFDTSDKICFPAVEDGLTPGVGLEGSDAAAVVDIDQLSRNQPADINTQHPPQLGYLPSETSQLLEARCQAWFDVQSSLKAIRVGAGFGCCLCADQLPVKVPLCHCDTCQLAF